MYHSFSMKNYRCFEDLTLTDLKRINLIAGKNNVGKTALMEAIYFHTGAYEQALALRTYKLLPDGGRAIRDDSVSQLSPLFYRFDMSKEINLVGEDNQLGRWTVSLQQVNEPVALRDAFRLFNDRWPTSSLDDLAFKILKLIYEHPNDTRPFFLGIRNDIGHLSLTPPAPTPPFLTNFLTPRFRLTQAEEAERFGRLEIMGRQDRFQQALTAVEPRLRRLTVVVVSGDPIIHADIGIGRLVPLSLMGDGIARLTNIVLAIATAANGVVFVDEVENGIHYSTMSQVWQVIHQVAEAFNTQVFATTHSFECIAAAHKAFAENDAYDFQLYRLEQTQEGIRAIGYDRESLEAALEIGLEVR